MRYVKGHFVLTGPDVPSMRFKEAEDERKLASALIVFSAFRVSNPPTRPGETAQNLMSSARPVDTICRKPCRSCRLANAQLTLEPSLNMLSAKSGKIFAATQTDFGPDGFRGSSLMTPASQSGLCGRCP